MSTNKRGYAAIGLFHPKTPSNIGGVLRAAACYQASMVAIQGAMYKRTRTDTLKAYRHIPTIHDVSLRTIIPFDCIPVAIECMDDAIPLPEFKHPERAFYVFGPEDGSISNEVLGWCKYKVVVPTRFCMNLAACVNVVLYDRTAKRHNPQKTT